MKKEECKKQESRPTRNALVNVMLTSELRQWLHKEKLSPTAIFRNACKELEYKGRL